MLYRLFNLATSAQDTIDRSVINLNLSTWRPFYRMKTQKKIWSYRNEHNLTNLRPLQSFPAYLYIKFLLQIINFLSIIWSNALCKIIYNETTLRWAPFQL